MYNREYLNNNVKTEFGKANSATTTQFLKATYQLFAASLLAGAAGTYVGVPLAGYLSGMIHWVLLAIAIGMIFFVLPKVKHVPGWNMVALFSFTFITGLMISPLLASVAMLSGGATIIGQAFLMTSVGFAGISMFALTTNRDFTSMGKLLWIALIVVIVGSISNIFIGSSMLQLGIASVSAILFSAFILYDTQKIIKGEYQTPMEASISLYLDFLNLFVSLLQILGIMNSND